MKTIMRTFEIHLNQNLYQVAYTLEVKNAKEARNYATREAKANRNDSVDIFEVGGKEYVSGTIYLNK